MASWMIVYADRKRKELSYTQIGEFEKSEWDLASTKEFETPEECEEYMIELADKHNLYCSGGKKYLD